MGRIKARVLSSALRASAPPDVAKSEASQAVGSPGWERRKGRVLTVSTAPALQKPPEQLLWKKKKAGCFVFVCFLRRERIFAGVVGVTSVINVVISAPLVST